MKRHTVVCFVFPYKDTVFLFDLVASLTKKSKYKKNRKTANRLKVTGARALIFPKTVIQYNVIILYNLCYFLVLQKMVYSPYNYHNYNTKPKYTKCNAIVSIHTFFRKLINYHFLCRFNIFYTVINHILNQLVVGIV